MTEQRTVLVVCDGNTCRSATLMLLLQYRAALQRLGDAIRIESAGLGKSAADEDPMPGVAQEAAAHAATRLLGLQEASTALHAESLSTLREQAVKHRSTQVSVSEAIPNYQLIVSLLTSKAIQKLDPSRALHSVTTTLHHPIGDNGFRMLRLHGSDQAHPAVIKAYQDQADRLARLVNGPLAHLLEGRVDA